MNKHDKDNFDYIMSLDQAEFDAWAEEADADDVQYALELICTAKAELTVDFMALEEAMQEENGLNCTEANAVIARAKQGAK